MSEGEIMKHDVADTAAYKAGQRSRSDTETVSAAEEQRARVREALTSDSWTEGEKQVLRWQWGTLGDYGKAFFGALMRADEQNLDRLSLGYPSTVEAFRSWKDGDLATRMRDAGVMD